MTIVVIVNRYVAGFKGEVYRGREVTVFSHYTILEDIPVVRV